MGFIKPTQAATIGSHKITAAYYEAYVHNDHDKDILWKNKGDWRFGLRSETQGYIQVPSGNALYKVDGAQWVDFPDLELSWTFSDETWFKLRAQEYDAVIDVDGSIFEPIWVDYTSETQIDVDFTSAVNEWHHGDTKKGDVTHYYTYRIENLAPTASAIQDKFAYAGVSLQFYGSGSDPEGDSLSYEWKFGDGATSTAQNPVHTYTEAGNYTVSFRAKDVFGEYSASQYADVEVTTIVIDQMFVSDSRCNVDSVQTIGYHAKWIHNNSDMVGGSIYVNETEYVTNTTGWITLNPVYETVGKHTWNVTGVNCTGITDYEQLVDNPYIIWDKVDVTLSVTDDTIEVGDTASITHTAVYQYDGTDFYGTITLDDTLTKSTVGTYYYTTQSISGDTYGITAFESNTVAVTFVDAIAPVANAGPDQTVDEDTPVTLDGSSSTDNVGITEYTWTFTDVTTKTLTGEKPTYTFNTPGVYTITLNVTDTGGNWATDTVAITVSDITDPTANAGEDQTANEDTVVTLDGSASTDNVGIASYTWTFSDVTLTEEKPTYTFDRPDVYTITLKVTDTGGNWATDTVTITVLDVTAPVADVGSDQRVKVDTSASFDASNSTDNVAIVSYEWDFGDGTTGTGKTTTHTYTEPGVYNVTLTVQDAAGNSDTDSTTVTVEGSPTVFPWWILGVVGAVIAAGIVATLLLWRRKASKGP